MALSILIFPASIATRRLFWWMNGRKRWGWFERRNETFAKYLSSPFLQQPEPKHRFSAVFASNHSWFYPNTPLILPGYLIIRNAFQQRRQVIALMGIGGSDVQFLDIAFLIGAGMLFVTESV